MTPFHINISGSHCGHVIRGFDYLGRTQPRITRKKYNKQSWPRKVFSTRFDIRKFRFLNECNFSGKVRETSVFQLLKYYFP